MWRSKGPWRRNWRLVLGLLPALLVLALYISMTPRLTRAAPISPYRAYAVGVSADSQPDGEAPGVRVLDVGRSLVDGLGRPAGVTVYGVVENGLDHPVGAVTIEVTASVDGETVASATTAAALDAIPAGGESTFSVAMPSAVPDRAAISCSVTAFTDLAAGSVSGALPVLLSGPNSVPIGIPDPKTHLRPLSPDFLSLDGTVTNTTSVAWHVAQISVAVYAADGTVGLAGSTFQVVAHYPGPDPALIEPGATGEFEVLFPNETLLQVPGAHYVAFVSAVPPDEGDSVPVS
jgi:hypothetical protein